jgi:hypothetical protein
MRIATGEEEGMVTLIDARAAKPVHPRLYKTKDVHV